MPMSQNKPISARSLSRNFFRVRQISSGSGLLNLYFRARARTFLVVRSISLKSDPLITATWLLTWEVGTKRGERRMALASSPSLNPSYSNRLIQFRPVVPSDTSEKNITSLFSRQEGVSVFDLDPIDPGITFMNRPPKWNSSNKNTITYLYYRVGEKYLSIIFALL